MIHESTTIVLGEIFIEIKEESEMINVLINYTTILNAEKRHNEKKSNYTVYFF